MRRPGCRASCVVRSIGGRPESSLVVRGAYGVVEMSMGMKECRRKNVKKIKVKINVPNEGIGPSGDISNGLTMSYEPVSRSTKGPGLIGSDHGSYGTSCIVCRPEYRGLSGIVVGRLGAFGVVELSMGIGGMSKENKIK